MICGASSAGGIVGRAHRKLQQLGDAPIRLSLFVVCELEAGVALSNSSEEHKRVRRLCQECDVIYPDERFAPLYGQTLVAPPLPYIWPSPLG